MTTKSIEQLQSEIEKLVRAHLTAQKAATTAAVERAFSSATTTTSKPTSPVAQQTIDLILELYRVEHTAKQKGIVGSDSHLQLRKLTSGPARDRLKAWLDEHLERRLDARRVARAVTSIKEFTRAQPRERIVLRAGPERLRPRWRRILSMTGGSSMTEMTRIRPLQARTSTLNTRKEARPVSV